MWHFTKRFNSSKLTAAWKQLEDRSIAGVHQHRVLSIIFFEEKEALECKISLPPFLSLPCGKRFLVHTV